MDFNPANSVRGPKHVVKQGKTPVFTADEAKQLLASIIPVTAHEGQPGPPLPSSTTGP